jgi:hypothetical protein
LLRRAGLLVRIKETVNPDADINGGAEKQPGGAFVAKTQMDACRNRDVQNPMTEQADDQGVKGRALQYAEADLAARIS